MTERKPVDTVEKLAREWALREYSDETRFRFANPVPYVYDVYGMLWIQAWLAVPREETEVSRAK